MSFRNRCTLAGGNGPIQLSIPLVGGRDQKTLMKDVRIDNSEKWQARHWKTITSCYNKSPWFEFFAHDLQSIYDTRHEYLAEWNHTCFKWLTDKMAINIPVSFTQEFKLDYDKNEYVDWRNHLVPASINRVYPSPKIYPQVFADRFGFIPNLSILDWLFCMGNKL